MSGTVSSQHMTREQLHYKAAIVDSKATDKALKDIKYKKGKPYRYDIVVYWYQCYAIQ